jgi:cytochrome-b5 reductase
VTDKLVLREELEALRDQSNGRFELFYCLNNPPANWTQGTGFVTKEMIEKHMPSKVPGEEKVLMCGPPPMMNAMK